MARRQGAYGGAPAIGTVTGEPSDQPQRGDVQSYGGAPTVKDRLSKGSKQVNRPAGETYPSGFGGAPTMVKNPSPRRTTGNAGNSSSDPTGVVP